MNQNFLFDPYRETVVELPRPVAAATRREAARKIAGKISGLQELVLDFLRQRGHYGATDDELCSFLERDSNTIRPSAWNYATPA